MKNPIHRGPVVLVLMLAGALIAAGLVRAGGTPPKNPGVAPPARHHGAAGSPAGAAKDEATQGALKTIVGEVMDPACYLEAGAKSISPGHFQCAVDCARSGQTLAVYDRESDRIYFVAGELPGKNPNEPLMPYIHKRVDVLGRVYLRSGVYGIVILKVDPHQEKPAGASTAPGSQAPPTRAGAPSSATGDPGAGK